MSVIIGIDFGSRASYISLWSEDKAASADDVEVITDEFGERSVTSAMAFRDGEVLIGEVAAQQRHKNMANTFVDVRSIITSSSSNSSSSNSSSNSSSGGGGEGGESPTSPDEDKISDDIFVESINAEISRVELVSKFFRYIHNEIKRQSNKVIRDCILALPDALDESVIEDIRESAKLGGIRVKHFVPGGVAALLAHGLDDPGVTMSNVLVADIGWGSTKLSMWNIKKGLFSMTSQVNLSACSGSKLANALVSFCCQDFQRKTKLLCNESKRSMARLLKECEVAIKNLSTAPEVNLEIDSLFEGVDYAVKISRARFDDLAMEAFNSLRAALLGCIQDASVAADADAITVIFAGGLCSLPKVKTVFAAAIPNMIVNRSRYDPSEVNSIGAALHGKYLYKQGFLESPPADEIPVASLSAKINIVTSSGDKTNVLGSIEAGSILPFSCILPCSSDVSKLSIFVDNSQAKTTDVLLGELSIEPQPPASSAKIVNKACVSVTEDSLSIVVESDNKLELGNLSISFV